MNIDIQFKERGSGKTTELLVMLRELSSEDSKSLFVVTNTHIASAYKRIFKNLGVTIVLPTSVMSNLRGRRDIKRIFMDETFPTLELIDFCKHFDIDIYFRGTMTTKYTKEQIDYLKIEFPEALI